MERENRQRQRRRGGVWGRRGEEGECGGEEDECGGGERGR